MFLENKLVKNMCEVKVSKRGNNKDDFILFHSNLGNYLQPFPHRESFPQTFENLSHYNPN